MEKQREPYWDVLKAILIITVIWGHTMIGIPNDKIEASVLNFIYVFHMPLFVFVSGKFSKISNRAKYQEGILKLLESFIVFQILHILVRYLVGLSDVKMSHFSYWLTPEHTLWYLVCLIYWRSMVLCIPQKIFERKKLFIMSSLMLGILGGCLKISVFSFQRAFCFLPFFMIGYLYGDITLERIRQIPLTVCLLVLTSIFAFDYLLIPCFMEKVLTGAFYYTSPNMILYRLFFYLIALIICIAVMRLVLFVENNNILSKIGCMTLFLYLYHWHLTRVSATIIRRGYISGNLIETSIIAISIILILVFLNRYRLLRWLINPITSSISRTPRKI